MVLPARPLQAAPVLSQAPPASPPPASGPAPPASLPPAAAASDSDADGNGDDGPPGLAARLGLPDWVQLSFSLTAQPMVNPGGGLVESAAWMQQISLGADLGRGLARPVQTWRELDHWVLHLHADAFSGEALWNAQIGAVYPLQSTAHGQGIWIDEISLERRGGLGPLSLKAGIFSLDNLFLQAPVFSSYVHSAFNDTLNVSLSGWPISPLAAPGVGLKLRTSANSELHLGGFWLDPQIAIASWLGVNPLVPDVRGQLYAVQWSSSVLPWLTPLSDAIQVRDRGVSVSIPRQLPAPLFQLGAVWGSVAIDRGQDIKAFETRLLGAGGNQTLYSTITLPLTLPIGLDHRIWLGGALDLDASRDASPSFLAGGWLAQGLLPGRPLDVLALGLGRAPFSPVLLPQLSAESMVELNYNIHINDQVSVQPLMQWVIQPTGSGRIPGIFALGVQLQIQL